MSLRCAIYLRHSTDLTKTENQRPEVEQIVRARGYEVVATFEEGVSAVKKRPEYERMMKRLERRIGFRRIGRSLMNPHSSEYYRAIQFTCRELVKVKNPTHQIYTNLKVQLESIHGGAQAIQEAFVNPPKPYEYVFFPYEIQIMDVKAYADSIFGKSNHEEYRRKQLEAARNRIFGRART